MSFTIGSSRLSGGGSRLAIRVVSDAGLTNRWRILTDNDGWYRSTLREVSGFSQEIFKFLEFSIRERDLNVYVYWAPLLQCPLQSRYAF